MAADRLKVELVTRGRRVDLKIVAVRHTVGECGRCVV